MSERKPENSVCLETDLELDLFQTGEAQHYGYAPKGNNEHTAEGTPSTNEVGIFISDFEKVISSEQQAISELLAYG